jgi:hypothetical protein
MDTSVEMDVVGAHCFPRCSMSLCLPTISVASSMRWSTP